MLSPIAKTLEKCILPIITGNIDQLDFQHGFKANFSTNTALHKINHQITEGFNKKKKPERTVLVSLDLSKAFDTVNIHTLIKKLLLTNIPNKLIKFLSNYLKGRQAYTILQDVMSKHRNLKTGVPQGGVLSPTLFNIYMSDIPKPPENVNLEVYADDMNTMSSDNNYHIAEQNLQPYLDEIFEWTKINDLQLNATKSSSTLFTTDPSEYNKQLSLTINNTVIPTVIHPKILGLTFDPKLNFGEHINKTKEKSSKTINIIKALTSTKWGKQKETLVTTYKTITRPIIEYGSTIWAPIASDTNVKKLQTIQNSALCTATGCTKDTNIQHLHDETNVLSLNEHLKLHASQLRNKTQLPTHPLNKLNNLNANSIHIRETIFDNKDFTFNKDYEDEEITKEIIESYKIQIHTELVEKYAENKSVNEVLQTIAPKINTIEETLSREVRRTLSQLRINKSPILFSYMHKINPTNFTSPSCPLCNNNIKHDTYHLFNCNMVYSSRTLISLWNDPVYVMSLLSRWRGMGGWPNRLVGGASFTGIVRTTESTTTTMITK